MERNVARVINDRPLGSFQVRILILSTFVLVLDGFDIGTISSTAKAISLDMHRSVTSFGPIFAAGFAGVLVGALVFGTLADRVGRKATVVTATLAFGVFTLITPLVHSYSLLLWIRVFTGIGLGGAVPNAVALTSEYIPGRIRAFAVNGISAGIALGGFLAPVLASWLLPQHGWKIVFVIGGMFPIALAVVMAAALPESLRFLSVRNPADPRARSLLRRIDPALTGDVTLTAERREAASIAKLFTRDRWLMTVLLSVMNFCTLTVALLMVSWLPTLLEATGLSVTSSLLTASLFSAAGVIGTLALGYVMVKRAPGAVLAIAFVCAAIGVAIFAFAGHSRLVLAIALLLAGFFLFGCQAAVNAVSSDVYPTAIRSTGVGWVLGSGRAGSIVGPFIAGTILTSLVHNEKLFIVVGIPALIGAVAALGVHRALTIPQSIQKECDDVTSPAH